MRDGGAGGAPCTSNNCSSTGIGIRALYHRNSAVWKDCSACLSRCLTAMNPTIQPIDNSYVVLVSQIVVLRTRT